MRTTSKLRYASATPYAIAKPPGRCSATSSDRIHRLSAILACMGPWLAVMDPARILLITSTACALDGNLYWRISSSSIHVTCQLLRRSVETCELSGHIVMGGSIMGLAAQSDLPLCDYDDQVVPTHVRIQGTHTLVFVLTRVRDREMQER